MVWCREQDHDRISIGINSDDNCLLQGTMPAVVDLSTLQVNTGLACDDMPEKSDDQTGMPDLAKQRVMVLVKATGEAVSVLVACSTHNESPCSLCILHLVSMENVANTSR
jgi:hypothetical protein